MTAHSHTPGPWRVFVDNRTDADNLIYVNGYNIEAESDEIVGCEGIESWKDNAEANARLIAAAPELLKELSLLASLVGPWVEAGNKIPGIATLNGAWAAIAKATQP